MVVNLQHPSDREQSCMIASAQGRNLLGLAAFLLRKPLILLTLVLCSTGNTACSTIFYPTLPGPAQDVSCTIERHNASLVGRYNCSVSGEYEVRVRGM